MSNRLNPYKEFLGLDTSPVRPTYYELLGLDPHSSYSDEQIETVRDSSLSAIRSFKPGANAVSWAALLDEVSLASETLLDQDLKKAYDAQLTSGVEPGELEWVELAGPIESVQTDITSKPSAAESPVADMMAPAHLQASVGSGLLSSAAVPTASEATAAIVTAQEAPVAVRASVAPTTLVSPESAVSEMNAISPARTRRSSKSSNLTVMVLAICAVLAAGGVAWVMNQNGKKQLALNSTDSGQNPPPPPVVQTNPKPEGTRPKPVVDPPDEKPRIRPPASVGENPLKPLPTDFGGSDDPVPPKPSPEPPATGTTDPDPETKPSVTDPVPTPEPITARELASLSAALKLGRVALAEHNLDITAEQLAIAEPLARSGEPKSAFVRLKTMHEFMVQFMKLANQAIDGFESGSEITVGTSTVVVVVETTNDKISIRVQGVNKTYSRNHLSTGLAMGIAQNNFEDFKYKTTLMAAYLAAQKNPREFDVTKAREYWAMGPESMDVLNAFLMDDYMFAAP